MSRRALHRALRRMPQSGKLDRVLRILQTSAPARFTYRTAGRRQGVIQRKTIKWGKIVDGTAIVATNGQLSKLYGKTAHGLIRGSERFQVVGVIDPLDAGKDAGEVVDGKRRGIPVFGSLRDALDTLPQKPQFYVLGYAAPGGRLPPEYRAGIEEAIRAGLSVVSGMHQFLGDDPVLAGLARDHNVSLIDVRKNNGQAHFWSGEIFSISTPRIAVLGMDCAIGKRTTARLLTETCNDHGIRTEMITTGQTGWMQGVRFGFIFDSVLNDFVCGELEHAIVSTAREASPDLIVIEGQSSLRHPAGPCGSEFIISGGARAVILQHAPGRKFFEGYERLGCLIPPVAEEVQLIRLLGAQVLAMTLNGERLTREELLRERAVLREELDLPVILPLEEDELRSLVPIVEAYIAQEAAA